MEKTKVIMLDMGGGWQRNDEGTIQQYFTGEYGELKVVVILDTGKIISVSTDRIRAI